MMSILKTCQNGNSDAVEEEFFSKMDPSNVDKQVWLYKES